MIDASKIGGYYVSCIDAGELYLMAGPYPTERLARDDKDKALEIAHKIDGRAWFMAWGTIRRKDRYRKPGRLNQLGLM
jgi:hypothetical protein